MLQHVVNLGRNEVWLAKGFTVTHKSKLRMLVWIALCDIIIHLQCLLFGADGDLDFVD